MPQKSRVMVAAHMGTWGANIPGNTFASVELALRQGADVMEIDVTKSADDVLFVFHPGTERQRLGMDIDIRRMSAAEIGKLCFVNLHGNRSSHHIVRLEEMLRYLKGRCLIDIDKFSDNPAQIAALVRSMDMQDQVLVLTESTREYFDMVAEVAWDLPYIAILREEDRVSGYLQKRRDIRFFGVDTEFAADTSALATKAFVDGMHRAGKKVWINSIRFDDRCPLAGSRCDDGALLGDPDSVWGWMAETGYDIVQTDWVLPLAQYLRRKGY